MGDSVAGRPNDMHDSSHAVRHAVSGSFRRLHTVTVPQHRQPPAPAAPIIHLLLPPTSPPFRAVSLPVAQRLASAAHSSHQGNQHQSWCQCHMEYFSVHKNYCKLQPDGQTTLSAQNIAVSGSPGTTIRYAVCRERGRSM